MPPRLTLRELQARRLRAEEGIERFKAARHSMGWADVSDSMRDCLNIYYRCSPEFQRFALGM